MKKRTTSEFYFAGGLDVGDQPAVTQASKTCHIARLEVSSLFVAGSLRSIPVNQGRDRHYAVTGLLLDGSGPAVLELRYPRETWTASRARAHFKLNNGIRFEAASSDSMLDTGAADAGYFTQKETTMSELTLDFKELLEAVETRGAFQFHAEIKAINEKDRIIEGYANTKNVDRVGERVEPSAFRRSLAPFKRRGKILRNHDWREPIGRPVDARIDDTGFWIKAKIEQGIDYVEEAWEQITRKLIDSFSIGYRVLKVSRPDDGEHPKAGDPWRIIELLDLYEVSVVTIPANVQSTFSIAKGMKHGSDLWHRDADLWAATGKDGLVTMMDKMPWAIVDSIPIPDESEYLLTSTPDPYAKTAEYVKKVAAEIEEGMKQASAIEALERANSELKAGGD